MAVNYGLGVRMVPAFEQLRIGLLLFQDFELLDACGPLGVFGRFPELDVHLLASRPGPVRSRQGVRLVADGILADAHHCDLLMTPGGQGVRRLVSDSRFLSTLADSASTVDCVTSVCTGSALLAAAGMLEGYRATSNLRAFEWVSGFGVEVNWVRGVRWVHDRDRWTSGGISAGIDMSLALMGHYFGETRMNAAASELEYEMRSGFSWD
ncbi:DJ-1/PfpI family protein [Actinomyces sp. Z5]|nr:DJ-1/PfpI family protein [Actinomyces sp. Z5]